LKAVVQRVSQACVRVSGEETGRIDSGLVVLLGVRVEDDEKEAAYLAEKTANLRVFPDEEGRMNLSLLDTGFSALIVSQFTIHGEMKKGRRPSYTAAAPPESAKPLYERFIRELADLGVSVASGVFGARMDLELTNDGPVTVIISSKNEWNLPRLD
jgi:D-tyrosyl-tRNA(Tyr) deacylase